MSYELADTEDQLIEIAEILLSEIKNSDEDIISRYHNIARYSKMFINGKEEIIVEYNKALNKETMPKQKRMHGLYSSTEIDYLTRSNFEKVCVSRDLIQAKVLFTPKKIPLPTNEIIYYPKLPVSIDMYDEELKTFTKEHEFTRLSRQLIIEQKIVVNSQGGFAIQSIPYFIIKYSHGYNPLTTTRNVAVVCTSDRDLKNLTSLIKYIPDPTLDSRIKKSKTFSEAFDELYNISKLKYENFNKAGIPLSTLYDVIMLSGVPIHEIFGHHFEELIYNLPFGTSATFKYGQKVNNDKITIIDNPLQKVETYNVIGFTKFDAYGRERKPRINIKNGEVKEFLGSEYIDDKNIKNYLGLDKSEFVGNAVQSIDCSFPQARMSCTVLHGHPEDIDLEGMIVAIPTEGSTNEHFKTYEVRAYEAYIIKDGEPLRVLPIKITGGINQALENIHLLKDITYETSVCVKSNPLNITSNAEIPVSQYTMNQMWAKQQVYTLSVQEEHLKILLSQ